MCVRIRRVLDYLDYVDPLPKIVKAVRETYRVRRDAQFGYRGDAFYYVSNLVVQVAREWVVDVRVALLFRGLRGVNGQEKDRLRLVHGTLYFRGREYFAGDAYRFGIARDSRGADFYFCSLFLNDQWSSFFGAKDALSSSVALTCRLVLLVPSLLCGEAALNDSYVFVGLHVSEAVTGANGIIDDDVRVPDPQRKPILFMADHAPIRPTRREAMYVYGGLVGRVLIFPSDFVESGDDEFCVRRVQASKHGGRRCHCWWVSVLFRGHVVLWDWG